MKKIILFCAFLLVFGIKVSTTKAIQNVTLTGEETEIYYYFPGQKFDYSEKTVIYRDEDDNILYCLNPHRSVNTLEYERIENKDVENITDLNLTDEIKKIIYFGYMYKGHEDIAYYFATQELIWEKFPYTYVSWSTGVYLSGEKIDVEKEKEEIMNLVTNYDLYPSFINNEYSGFLDETLILIDENDVLKYYEIDNENVIIDGNKLEIKLNSEGKNQVNLTRNFGDNKYYVYTAENSQKMASVVGLDLDPINITLNYEGIKKEEVKIELEIIEEEPEKVEQPEKENLTEEVKEEQIEELQEEKVEELKKDDALNEEKIAMPNTSSNNLINFLDILLTVGICLIVKR